MSASAGQGSEVTYPSDKIAGGKNNVVNNREFAAGTYVRGQIVAFNTSTNKFVLYVDAGANGTGVARAIVAESKTLGSAGALSIMLGDFQRAGVEAVMAALSTPVTVTDVMIADLDAAGCHLKRK
jgi:hypothetical protein